MKKTKVQVPLVPLLGKQNILEMRVPQKLARLSGEAHKMSGMEGGENWRVNCVTGENRFQPQNIQAKEVFYNKSFENLLGAQIPFIHVYTRIPKSAKNITLKLTRSY